MVAPIHGFDECLGRGSVGERIAEQALRSRPDWLIERNATARTEQGDLGIDSVGRFGRHRGTIQVKTDMRGWESKRIAFELEHRHHNGTTTEGWLRTTTATFLVVLLAERAVIERIGRGELDVATQEASMLVLSVAELRDLEDGWREKHPHHPAQNADYQTWNVCVPVGVVRASKALLADYRVEYGVSEGRLYAKASNRPRQGGLFS